MARGNSATSSVQPKIELTTSAGHSRTSQGAVGGAVFNYSTAELNANATITAKFYQCTTSQSYNSFTIIFLHN